MKRKQKDALDQQSLYLFLPGIIQYLATWLAEDRGKTPLEALKYIYQTPTYRELEVEDTKKWHWSPVDLLKEIEGEL